MSLKGLWVTERKRCSLLAGYRRPDTGATLVAASSKAPVAQVVRATTSRSTMSCARIASTCTRIPV